VKALAESLPKNAWQKVAWAEGTRGVMESRFAALRVRPAQRDYKRSEPRPEEWLLIEWPESESEPTKYWLSTLPENAPIAQLVRTTKLRWRIERDYQEMKDELGMDHYEGRGWRGFHHHLSLCAATYAFIVAERSRLSPPTVQSIFGFIHAPPGTVPLPRGHGRVPA
jgi:SRSO17 transposase